MHVEHHQTPCARPRFCSYVPRKGWVPRYVPSPLAQAPNGPTSDLLPPPLLFGPKPCFRSEMGNERSWCRCQVAFAS